MIYLCYLLKIILMNNENKRYQVFISSTFVDLKEERSQVTQAIMELNHMPYGMEAFPAANETQWEWIKKAIKESDYYIVIIGGKYGSVNSKTGLSYTEMEYRYAEEVGVPTIAFLVDNSVDLPNSKTETDPIKTKKLQEFKKYIENNKLRKSYISKEDLKSKVIISFMQLISNSPRTGWIRADSLKNYTSNDEIIQLMKENIDLKKWADLASKVERHIEAYITLREDAVKLLYCSHCWDSEKKLIQMNTYDNGKFKCPHCENSGIYDKYMYEEDIRKSKAARINNINRFHF